MKDEIKEIDRIIINVKRKLQFSPERRIVELFDKDDINKLLDYITNSQNQLEEKTYLYNKLDTESKYVITNLQEELKSANESITWWQNRFNALQEENKRLKENICDIDFMKKEYGKHFKDYDIETTFKDVENLSNILNNNK